MNALSVTNLFPVHNIGITILSMFLNLFLLLTYCHSEDEKNFIAPLNFQFVIKQWKQWNLSKTHTWKSIMNLSTEDFHVFQITNNILPLSLTRKFTCYSILKWPLKIQFMQVLIWIWNKIKDYFTRKHLLLVLASLLTICWSNCFSYLSESSSDLSLSFSFHWSSFWRRISSTSRSSRRRSFWSWKRKKKVFNFKFLFINLLK